MKKIYATTILAVRYNKKLVFIGDGQVTQGAVVLKHHAKKVRKIEGYDVLGGFAGSAADAFTLFEMFEKKLKEFSGNLTKASVALAKDWRADKYLRVLEASLLVGDKKDLYLISGDGNIVAPDSDNIMAIGSGGDYALSAAKGIISTKPKLSAKDIATKAMKIASEICIYTNDNFTLEEIDC
ncbi:MAG: ATP-dependent protease subunit HslV [Bdellovibrionota bacterium]